MNRYFDKNVESLDEMNVEPVELLGRMKLMKLGPLRDEATPRSFLEAPMSRHHRDHAAPHAQFFRKCDSTHVFPW